MDESNNDSVEINCHIDPENLYRCELKYEKQVLTLYVCIYYISILIINNKCLKEKRKRKDL